MLRGQLHMLNDAGLQAWGSWLMAWGGRLTAQLWGLVAALSTFSERECLSKFGLSHFTVGAEL